jgi:hypothetical protein
MVGRDSTSTSRRNADLSNDKAKLTHGPLAQVRDGSKEPDASKNLTNVQVRHQRQGFSRSQRHKVAWARDSFEDDDRGSEVRASQQRR